MSYHHVCRSYIILIIPSICTVLRMGLDVVLGDCGNMECEVELHQMVLSGRPLLQLGLLASINYPAFHIPCLSIHVSHHRSFDCVRIIQKFNLTPTSWSWKYLKGARDLTLDLLFFSLYPDWRQWVSLISFHWKKSILIEYIGLFILRIWAIYRLNRFILISLCFLSSSLLAVALLGLFGSMTFVNVDRVGENPYMHPFSFLIYVTDFNSMSQSDSQFY